MGVLNMFKKLFGKSKQEPESVDEIKRNINLVESVTYNNGSGTLITRCVVEDKYKFFSMDVTSNYPEGAKKIERVMRITKRDGWCVDMSGSHTTVLHFTRTNMILH